MMGMGYMLLVDVQILMDFESALENHDTMLTEQPENQEQAQRIS